MILLPLADSKAYVDRYTEPDKAQTGLGAGTEAWPAPYWTIDTSMAVMTLLLAAEDAGLGALFFGVFRASANSVQRLGIPPGWNCSVRSRSAIPPLRQPIAAIRPPDAARVVAGDRSRQIIHRGRW